MISRAERHLDAAGHLTSTVHVEATELLARHTDQTRTFRDEITARNRFTTEMARDRRDRGRSLDRDDGLEL